MRSALPVGGCGQGGLVKMGRWAERRNVFKVWSDVGG